MKPDRLIIDFSKMAGRTIRPSETGRYHVYDTFFSAFHQDPLRPGWTRWVWEFINIPAFLGTMMSGTLATGIVVMLLQWFLTGFFLVWLVYGKRER